MLSSASWLIFSLYAAAAFGLLVYGINCYVMLYLFFRKKDKNLLEEQHYIDGFYLNNRDGELPSVTTQLPIYNEFNVAARIIRAAAALEYPHGKHQVQVLDDSTDATRELIDREVNALKLKGVDITVIRRANRQGFKAGALANGLKSAGGELITIFDADFIPRKDFLLRTAPLFLRDNRLGLVQARWGHVNHGDSLLAGIQAIGIDGHFMVEQPARAWNGLFMNFNGTAGILRKEAITAAGGWHWDTLTEDMDLSYRMQFRGWKTHYSLSTIVPAELPENIHAFKSQQFRWAKGSIQTALKLMGSVMKSDMGAFAKLQAFLHLTHYCVHPLMLTLSLLALPVLLTLPFTLSPAVFVVFAFFLILAMTGPSALYTGSQICLGSGWKRRLGYLPLLVCLGVGLALSNTRGVIEALIGKQSPFVRTPKKGDRQLINYNAGNLPAVLLEFTLALYCFVSFVFYIKAQKFLIGPFLAIYCAGYFYIAVLGLLHHINDGAKYYRPILAAISGLFLIIACLWLGSIASPPSRLPTFLLLYTALWFPALLFFLALPKNISRLQSEIWIVTVAALCRIAIFNHKTVFLSFDLAALFLILVLLRLKNKKARLAALYAFNPVILISLAAPTLHLWYLAWLIPFLYLTPAWSGAVLCLTMGLYYITDRICLESGYWDRAVIMQLIQWLPVYAVIVCEVIKRAAAGSVKISYERPRSVSVVVPVLNAQEHIDKCLSNLDNLKPAPLEVIVVDGGSGDNTVAEALKHNIRLIKSSRGRGKQIWRAATAARGDVTAVIHADTLPEANTIKQILDSFKERPDIIGGAVGQRFNESTFCLTLVELLNDLRAAFFGISFGDQVQFFRTQPACRHNLIPQWPLMEDVELSIRLGRLGRHVYLWGNAVVSNYKWQAGFAKRFYKVVYILSIFFIRRFRNNMETQDLYNLYYGKAGSTNK